MLFHDPDYVKYLKNYVSPDYRHILPHIGYEESKYNAFNDRTFNISDPKKKQAFKVGESSDCPGFDGLYNFC
jgi:hypothetical protein